MLAFDLRTIGNKLYQFRKAKGLTQVEVAERSDLSDRTYADIERGNVTMRVDSLVKICNALNITPNDILISQPEKDITEQDIAIALTSCSASEKITALKLLNVYVDSIK